MDNVTIRLLGPEHITDVHALWKAAGLPFHPSGRDSISRMTRELELDHVFLAGAFQGEALVAVVLGTEDGRKGWINRLAVRPSLQKQGLAKALVAFCERRFKSRGLGMVCALIEEDNHRSMALFSGEEYEERLDIHYFRKMLAGEDW